jgi:hypothetical protein
MRRCFRSWSDHSGVPVARHARAIAVRVVDVTPGNSGAVRSRSSRGGSDRSIGLVGVDPVVGRPAREELAREVGRGRRAAFARTRSARLTRRLATWKLRLTPARARMEVEAPRRSARPSGAPTAKVRPSCPGTGDLGRLISFGRCDVPVEPTSTRGGTPIRENERRLSPALARPRRRLDRSDWSGSGDRARARLVARGRRRGARRFSASRQTG